MLATALSVRYHAGTSSTSAVDGVRSAAAALSINSDAARAVDDIARIDHSQIDDRATNFARFTMTIERRNILKELSAADLRSELIARLRDEIARHEREIEALNAQIRQLQPTQQVIVRRAIRTRGLARNERPLRQVIAEVLRTNGEPMSINEIMDAVKHTGYQSNATNFRGVVSMSLSNNQMFEKTGRGVYTLRPGAIITGDDDMDDNDGADEGDGVESRPMEAVAADRDHNGML
jgi:hypothetical protein